MGGTFGSGLPVRTMSQGSVSGGLGFSPAASAFAATRPGHTAALSFAPFTGACRRESNRSPRHLNCLLIHKRKLADFTGS